MVDGTSSLLHSEIPVSKCNVLKKTCGNLSTIFINFLLIRVVSQPIDKIEKAKSFPEPFVKCQLNLANNILGEDSHILFKWRNTPFRRKDNNIDTVSKLKKENFLSRPTGPIITNLGTKHLWVKGIFSFLKCRPRPYPQRNDTEKTKIHLRNLKTFSSLEKRDQFVKIWHKAYLCEGLSSYFLNK